MNDAGKKTGERSRVALQVIEGGGTPDGPEVVLPEGVDWVPGVLEDLGNAVEGAGFGEAAREIHVTRLRVAALIAMRM
ncbi:hypothetical protein [uncultured Roseobacter sp.]|uniref:hypothetical protein n=1 Tax=uncultured Roseobacter sp. TaxID=114847 RepID=UPI0026332F6F|nr:hypothetical protein [uncultured Roseobacter sp.]